MEVRPLAAEDVVDVARLHRFSSTAAGGAVFGGYDVAEVLAAAAAQQQG